MGTCVQYSQGGTVGGATTFLDTVTMEPAADINVPAGETWVVQVGGTDELILSGTNLTPGANDGNALGASGTAWADLFLASGAVIDFAAGNVVATHSSGILTVGTGDLRVTTAGTNTASVVTVGGTQTLTAKTLTSPTIGTSPTAAGATWADLGTVTTCDINGGTIDGATIGGSSAGAVTGTTITATSFVIGGNTLTTSEWAFLDGQNQAVATTSSPTFANLTITSFAANWTNAGRTVADLGIVTTADINGGTLDGVSIGASSPSTAVFSAVNINPTGAASKTMTAGTQYTGSLGGYVQTTDATVTTIATITLDTDQTLTCQAIISGVLSDGSKGYHGVIVYGARKDGAASAVEVLPNAVLASANSDSAVFTAVAFSVTGNTAILQVTGAAANTINWVCEIDYSVADI